MLNYAVDPRLLALCRERDAEVIRDGKTLRHTGIGRLREGGPERVFDIVKIFPAGDAERLPGGWGIVVDDLVAGAWAALLVLAVRAAMG